MKEIVTINRDNDGRVWANVMCSNGTYPVAYLEDGVITRCTPYKRAIHDEAIEWLESIRGIYGLWKGTCPEGMFESPYFN